MKGDSHPVIVMHSPAGEGRSSFTPPFDPNQLAQTASTLEKEVRTRHVVSRDAAAAATASLPQQLGDQLFNALFSGVVRSLFFESLGMMKQQQRGLRIKLHIDPEEPSLAPLLALPWEFLYRKETREFLNLSVSTPILRDLDVQRPSMPLRLQPPLRILVFAAAPIDYPKLDLEYEREKLENIFSRLEGVQVDYLLHATIASLQDRLSEGAYHVLHFMGHGGFDDVSGRGVLLLEDEQQVSQRVDGGTLSVLLHDFASLRLVFLNACETARLSSDQGLDPFAGVASSLLMAGIPAVVAMQFPISDRAAVLFSHRFYSMLVRGQPVDASVAEGRKAVRTGEADTLEWGTPVLFSTAPNGIIFTLTGPPQPQAASKATAPVKEGLNAEEQTRLEKLYDDGLEAFWLEDWPRAAALFQQVLDAQSDYKDARQKLADALLRQEAALLYAQAVQAGDAGDWPAAVAALEQLEARRPGYLDSAARLQEARRSAQLADLYAEARRMSQRSRWQAVLKVFAQIQAIDAEYPDPEGLLAKAQAEAAAETRKAELDNLYKQALAELDAGRWAEAIVLLNQVVLIQPGFRQVAALLTRAQEKVRLQKEALARSQAEREKEDKIALLYGEAQKALSANNFTAVQEKLSAIIALNPAFNDSLALGAQAKDGLDRQAAEQAQKAELAARQADLNARYTEALRLLNVGRYQAALDAWEALHADEPIYPDRENVVARARQAREGEKQAAAPSPGIIERLQSAPRWIWYAGIGGLAAILLLIIYANRPRSMPAVEPPPTATPTLPQATAMAAEPNRFTDDKGVPMALVTAGKFLMGSDQGGSADQPEHWVSLDDYWMDIFEVTNASFAECVQAGACTPPAGKSSITRENYYNDSQYADYPVIYVSWDQAQAYCAWREARLPTEAEWEKAARGTNGWIYPWGDTLYESKQDASAVPDDTGPVRSFADMISPYGLYNMSGNVAEWVSDWFQAGYYAQSPDENPQGPTTGEGRVYRGGTFYDFPLALMYTRYTAESSYQTYWLGFRCARSAEGELKPESNAKQTSSVVQATAATATAAATPASDTTQQPTPTLSPPIADEKGVPMALVPAGAFIMGSDQGNSDEQPAHTVTLGDYYIDLYEVSNIRYAACVHAGVCYLPHSIPAEQFASDDKLEYPNHPVQEVSWEQAQEYCAWRGARLPTEAEWEKAARGTDERVYPWAAPGEPSDITSKGNFNNFPTELGVPLSEPVGSYPEGTSPYGLYDMIGNLSEWVADWYQADYYAQSPDENPLGPASGEERGVRGGSALGGQPPALTYSRGAANPNGQYTNVGFRCARSP